MEKIAFYAGSFDPFTVGHFRIVCEALCSYDKVVIGIGCNPDKQTGMFNVDERRELIQTCFSDFRLVWQNNRFSGPAVSLSEKTALKRLEKFPECLEIIAYDDLTIDAALRCGATSLLRGKRITGDDEEEMQWAMLNRQLLQVRHRHLNIDLLPVPQENLTYVSSSAFKKLCALGEYIAAMPYVSAGVHNAMMKKCLKPIFVEAYHETFAACIDAKPQTEWQTLLQTREKREYHNLSYLAYGVNYLNICRAMAGLPATDGFGEFLLAWFRHNTEGGTPEYEKLKNMLIHDLDLAILGDTVNYNSYTLGIRLEDKDTDDQTYCSRRMNVLQQLLWKPLIFSLPFFREMLETDARANIRYEFANLQPLLTQAVENAKKKRWKI